MTGRRAVATTAHLGFVRVVQIGDSDWPERRTCPPHLMESICSQLAGVSLWDPVPNGRGRGTSALIDVAVPILLSPGSVQYCTVVW